MAAARAPALLVAFALACGTTSAQTNPRPGTRTEGTPPKPVIVTLLTYTEDASRTAFAAIDRDADDRLDIFEFVASQDESVAGPPPTAAFRRLDLDRDGFLDWPEFDARVRNALRLNGQVQYRPARVLPAAKPVQTNAGAAEHKLDPRARGLMNLLDSDRSGRVSRDEFETFAVSAGLPASAIVAFVEADADGDASLDAAEFAKLLELLPNAPRGPGARPSSRSFSPAWRRADVDGDGDVSASELEVSLRRHALHLGRWAAKVVADADRSGDRRLGPAEVLASEPRK